MPFDQILAFLSRLLPGLRRSRQKTLAWLILGFLQGSDWPEKRTLSALIRAIPRKVSFEAKKKQLYRFFKNPAFNLTAFNRTLWFGLTRYLPQDTTIGLSIDWVTKGRWALLGAA